MSNFVAPLMEGASAHLELLRSQITKIAPTGYAVLIEGETGTGKELVARLIHACSSRRTGPFVAVNCAALVESLLDAELFGTERGAATDVTARPGKFEQAHGGTLFLDEVSELSAAAQAKLLRVVQDLQVERIGGSPRAVDVRVVAATNQSLRELMQLGRFRADLFYRLNAIEMSVAPLRERIEDIVPLALHFLKVSSRRPMGISVQARNALIAYEWPGNVRELQRSMERASVFCDGDEVRLTDLPPAIRSEAVQAGKQPQSLDSFASRHAQIVFEQTGRNKKAACRILGITYQTLNRRLAATQPPRPS